MSVFERLCLAYGVPLVRGAAERLSERTGVNINTVKGWRQRDRVPVSHLQTAAAATGKSLDWFLTGQGVRDQPSGASRMQPRSNAASELDASRSDLTARETETVYGQTMSFAGAGRAMQFVLVPRYAVKASAGMGTLNGDDAEQSMGEIAFEAEWMRRTFGRAGTGFALVDVSGNSMEPTLWDGETVVVDLQAREVISGGVYLLRDGDELLVKRLHRLLGGGVQVVSDNASYPVQTVDQRDELGVVGRVVWPRVR